MPSSPRPPFIVVDISGDEVCPTPLKIAVSACAGLLNARADKNDGTLVYLIHNQRRDYGWLQDLNLSDYVTKEPVEFVNKCTDQSSDFQYRCIIYSYRKQRRILPNILTFAAIHDVVPLDEDLLLQTFPNLSNNETLIYASDIFKNRTTPVEATRFMYDTYAHRTTDLAMINPGYATWNCLTPWNPPLTQDMNVSFIDYVFKNKLFVVFLINSGIPWTAEHRWMHGMAANHPWRQTRDEPIRVYGYADHWHIFGGFLFEAHTRLVSSYNMGAIPTASAANLSFFSSLQPEISRGKLVQDKHKQIRYDPLTTYVAFVVGDGDNVSFMQNERVEWMKERVRDCNDKGSEKDDAHKRRKHGVLTWSISPHLAHLAPSILDWYYSMAKRTSMDHFMLPPSGCLYAYPGSMPSNVQDKFVEQTEEAAMLLDTSCTISWDWFTSWFVSERRFLPQYGNNGIIRSIFPSNVPFLFPTLTWWRRNQFYKVLDQSSHGCNHPVVLFRPREWRGVDGGIFGYYRRTPQNMAQEIGSYPRGTVAYVYMSSDEGLNLGNSFQQMLYYIPNHVELVSAEAAATLVLQAREEARRSQRHKRTSNKKKLIAIAMLFSSCCLYYKYLR